MPQNVTKTEFTAYKTLIDDQIDAINKQLAQLRFSPEEVFIDQLNTAKVFLNSRMDELSKQLAVLRNSVQIEEDGGKCNVVKQELEEKITALNIQIARLRDDLNVAIENAATSGSDITFQSTIEDQIKNINAQIQGIRVEPPTPDARFEVIKANIDEKLDSINKQISVLRQTQIQEVQLQELEVYKANVQQQIDSINQQIQQIRQLTEQLQENITEGSDIDIESIIAQLQTYINEQIANIIVQPGNILASSFDFTITEEGDTWTGTEYNGGISTTSKVFTELLVKSVTTRIPSKPTDFILNITGINDGNFTWELESMALVYDADITVMYTWSK